MSKSNFASGSRTASPVPGASSAQTIDPYRPLALQVQKPILPLLTSSSTEIPNLPSLFALDPSTYSSRVSGKTLQFDQPQPIASGSSLPTSSSSLIVGKKRNRGNESDRLQARKEQETQERSRKELGLTGLRKVKKRLGGVIPKGSKISYTALTPLYHLHTSYLIALLALPQIPHSPTQLPQINPETILAKLSKADFTGAKLYVVSSKNPSLEGIGGIVIEETAGTFRLVCENDQVKVISKNGSLFRLNFPAYAPLTTPTEDPPDLSKHISICPQMQIDILGTAFGYRSGERAGRKFRPAQGGGGGSGWGEEWVEGEWKRTLSSLEDTLGGNEGGNPRRRGDRGKTGDVGSDARRKRGKSRRKDPPAGGNLEVHR